MRAGRAARLAAGAGLRLAGAVLFLPLAVPYLAVAMAAVLCDWAAVLVLGPDDDRTDRILLNRAVLWSGGLPVWLFTKAGQVRQGAVGK